MDQLYLEINKHNEFIIIDPENLKEDKIGSMYVEHKKKLIFTCPTCEKTFNNISSNCPHCGQKIKGYEWK